MKLAIDTTLGPRLRALIASQAPSLPVKPSGSMLRRLDDSIAFLRRLDDYQHHLRLRRVEACRRLPISEGQLSGIRSGRVAVSSKMWQRLADAECRAGMSTPSYEFQCPECGFDHNDAGQLASEKQIYCGMCAGDCKYVILDRTLSVKEAR